MKKRIQMLIPIFLVLALTLSCNLPTRTNPLTAYSDGLIQNHVSLSDPNGLASYTLSAAQTMVMDEIGLPDRLLIQFDSTANRTEFWYYDQLGLSISFENGFEVKRAETAPILHEGLGSTYYLPQNFTKNMTLDDILVLTGENGFYLETVQNGIIGNGKLVFIKGFALMFIDNQLRHVETIPIGNAGQQSLITEAIAPATESSVPSDAGSAEKIIFYSEMDGGRYDIYSIAPDGSDLVNLTNDPGGDMDPACSLDGQQIAFVSDRTGVDQIYLMDTSGGQLAQLTNVAEFGPSSLYWLDPYTILFWNGFGEAGYYTLDVETGELIAQSSTYGQSVLSSASLPAPNGEGEIDYRYDADNSIFQIFLMDANGERLLSPDDGYSYMDPVWSPDGQQIGFSSDRSGRYQVYIMDRNGNILIQLTNRTGRSFIGCWLP